MVTVVLAATGDVAIVNDPVKLFAGAVTVAGTLAAAGLLLDRLITAPPNGAPALSTTVPLDGVPAHDRRRIGVERRQHRPAVDWRPGVTLRTADHAPATPAS